MALTVPEWITADFLQTSLRTDERYKDIYVTDFASSPAAPAGNNYGSVVVRVTINCKLRGNEHKLSVVIKGPITEGPMGQLQEIKKDSEPLFYNVFLPEAYKILDKPFAPHYFKSSMPSAIVMEDLKESGYLMLDRTTPLDLDHCRLYMKAAASFHASSMALCNKDQEMIFSLCTEGFYQKYGGISQFFKNLTKWSIECMANHISNKNISEMLKNNCTFLWDILIELHKPESQFSSLVQGDPWITNMLFKYNENGVASDIKLIDFQNLTFGSPIHDVIYFIWLSASDEVKRYHLHDIYSFYLTQLNTNLKTFGCQEIDYDIFMDTIKTFSPLALVMASYVPCVLDSTPLPISDLLKNDEDFKTVKNPFDKCYTEHFCQTRLPHIIYCLTIEGIFEYFENRISSVKVNSS